MKKLIETLATVIFCSCFFSSFSQENVESKISALVVGKVVQDSIEEDKGIGIRERVRIREILDAQIKDNLFYVIEKTYNQYPNAQVDGIETILYQMDLRAVKFVKRFVSKNKQYDVIHLYSGIQEEVALIGVRVDIVNNEVKNMETPGTPLFNFHLIAPKSKSQELEKLLVSVIKTRNIRVKSELLGNVPTRKESTALFNDFKSRIKTKNSKDIISLSEVDSYFQNPTAYIRVNLVLDGGTMGLEITPFVEGGYIDKYTKLNVYNLEMDLFHDKRSFFEIYSDGANYEKFNDFVISLICCRK